MKLIIAIIKPFKLDDVKQSLAAAGIRIHAVKDLAEKEVRSLDKYFRQAVFPVLTPHRAAFQAHMAGRGGTGAIITALSVPGLLSAAGVKADGLGTERR